MVEYKVKRILIDQGSFANILYWSTYKKLGLSVSSLEECSGTLYGFAGSQPFEERESTINILDLDLEPQHQLEHGRPLSTKDLKEVQIGPLASPKTKIGTTLGKEEEDYLTLFLSKNKEVFTWSPADMPGIDPNFICHCLSITLGSRPIV
ncbi:hypothetical protein CR513_31310, partial [Mucuna pruriens]